MLIAPFGLLLIRAFIGGYFVLAAIPKITEPLAFATSIYHYGLVPVWAINAIALILPWLELLAGSALLLGYKTKLAAALCGLMLLIFTLAVAWAVANGLHIDCGCFGEAGGEEVSWWKVGKNTLMIAGTELLWFYPQSWLSLDERLAR
ncbi:MAG: DoxX family membrane protein [Ignavibacteria bacterium]|nr:DoxX family membrane protein [Ignavibacteria bacterium]